jgi:predicted nucleic acid-binding protein
MTDSLVTTLNRTMNSIKGTGDFSNSFWRFIKEEIGIHNVYPETKKKISFEERQAKVDAMLEKVEFEDDKLTPAEALLAKW